ncbi:hypothetical protein E6P09_12880 [Haloferax mediterranei ATCC 33500]|uniref:Uncharacterized protein n=1 Tax=Haloferax mediterranei (strain ATCC 33500 / DSM 1411 / JCM 8866 / NBRC 14739 / NCIMB 2177 / R-4) TaxID=523841 RepID=M0INC7_HALMT|nr:hypothetical protein [Haloferax mediterranei]AHZ23817.1 hypothetical protein BM92_14700 [Haloferax mediterranei ATCC 33500]ELZ98240.1 hypothetical protein C439_15685 [Haloferax mediterranei ATCC 33500]MDX5986788.1 hypothetical protein [Haloferax mediterranei ATCC 33500]QCQ76113.1 hypothetical protein E6P09_12880 [Haloferax mediterranei ATCC 33500]
MVGPSLSDDETKLANSRLKLGFILLIGVSATLIAVQAGATLLQTGLALIGGLLVGVLLTRYLSKWSREFTEVNRR